MSNGTRKRIVCFGDSNTWGFIGGTRQRFDEDTRWTGLLQTLLGDGYAVVEEGLNGRTTVFRNPFVPHTNAADHIRPVLLSAAPIDLLIMMLGTNDFQLQIAATPSAAAQGVGLLVEEARSFGLSWPGEEMKVLIIAPTAIDESRLSLKEQDCIDARGVESSRLLAGELQTTARLLNCYFLDANDYIVPGRTDGTHWDAEGHRIMADVICREVKRIFAEGN